MTPRSFVSRVSLALLVLVAAACGGDDGPDDPGPTGPTGPFTLTFTGDASFQGAHGGQEIRVVVVGGGSTVASGTATLSATADPAFTFTFPDVLAEGQSYQVKYWIDSNFGGGTPGVCDPVAMDHQWQITIPSVTDDVVIADTHRPGETQLVCDAFSFNLTFTGDASFQGAHGGQMLTAAVIKKGTTPTTVATSSTTVSATGDSAFSLSFAGVLVAGAEYQIHYWIDSNFGGGVVGVCDPKANDHQWSIEVPAVSGDVVVDDTHRPAETSDVCATFG